MYNGYFGMSSGKIGAIAELVVCADLMRRGYEVFRAMSAASNSDAIAIKNNEIYKFEIRTGNYFVKNCGDKRLHYGTHNIAGKIVAVVTHIDNVVHYIDWQP